VKAGDECKHSRKAVLVFRASDEDKAIKAALGDTTTICDKADCAKHGKQGSSSSSDGSTRKALSGMAFVSHKQSLLKQSRPERLRWLVFQALDKKLDDLGAPAGPEWRDRMDWLGQWADGHLSNDCARDAVKALGLWDKKKKSINMNWRKTFMQHYEKRPWAYALAVLAASAIRGDTWGGAHNMETSNLFRLARSFRVNVGLLQTAIQKGDRELISGMTKRAKAKAAKPRVKAAKKAA
jgi:hypothetical protein